jgi:hypothetical protein
MTSERRQKRISILAFLTFIVAFAPYFVPYEWQYTTNSAGDKVPSFLPDVIIGAIWAVLCVSTLVLAKWERKALWLLALFPIVFGQLLFLFLFSLSVWPFGFAP